MTRYDTSRCGLPTCMRSVGTRTSPRTTVPTARRSGVFQFGPNVAMNPGALAQAGGRQPHNNMSPYLGLNFCIALEGIYPSRS